MMKQKIEQFSAQLSQLIDWIGRTVSWLVVGMVVVTFVVVVMRYLFDTGWVAVQESISYMHSVVFLLGAAYTLKFDEHVRVDIIYTRIGDKGRAWVDLVGHIVMLIPVMIFIIWISYPYVEASWEIKESSKEAGGLPGVFLLKSLIIIMAGLLMLQGLALMLKSVLCIVSPVKPNNKPQPGQPGATM